MSIKIIELIKAEKLLEQVVKTYVNTGLKYGWKSSNGKSYDYGHWNKQILKSNKNLVLDFTCSPYIKKNPLIDSIWQSILPNIEERALLRCYINGYTYGTDAYFHTDDNWIAEKYGDNTRSETIIVYINPEWHYDWGGETVILNEAATDIVASILPKLGRVLIFDSNRLHSARPVTRACPVLRSVLVFKTISKDYIDPQVAYVQNLTQKFNHSSKTFFEHLYNTAIILEKNKFERDVYIAGLFHSIYGTEYYTYEGLKPSRDDIKKQIGEYSEFLVNEFCNLKGRFLSLMQNTKNYNDKVLSDLLKIEWANLCEQNRNAMLDNKILQIEEKIFK